tara:strand:+ start:9208 stop:9555 length:348 start_codon:yes stop_codon:yes gene_type:complete
MKKILLTLGLSVAAIAISFNGISQTAAVDANKTEALEVAHKCEKDSKKTCVKSNSKKSCAKKCSSSKSSDVKGTKQEVKVTKGKSCTKGKKACCKSKMNKSEPKLEKRPTKIKAN